MVWKGLIKEPPSQTNIFVYDLSESGILSVASEMFFHALFRKFPRCLHTRPEDVFKETDSVSLCETHMTRFEMFIKIFTMFAYVIGLYWLKLGQNILLIFKGMLYINFCIISTGEKHRFGNKLNAFRILRILFTRKWITLVLVPCIFTKNIYKRQSFIFWTIKWLILQN